MIGFPGYAGGTWDAAITYNDPSPLPPGYTGVYITSQGAFGRNFNAGWGFTRTDTITVTGTSTGYPSGTTASDTIKNILNNYGVVEYGPVVGASSYMDNYSQTGLPFDDEDDPFPTNGDNTQISVEVQNATVLEAGPGPWTPPTGMKVGWKAHTWKLRVGEPQEQQLGGLVVWSYPLAANCTPTTTPPDLNDFVTIVLNESGTVSSAYVSDGFCYWGILGLLDGHPQVLCSLITGTFAVQGTIAPRSCTSGSGTIDPGWIF